MWLPFWHVFSFFFFNGKPKGPPQFKGVSKDDSPNWMEALGRHEGTTNEAEASWPSATRTIPWPRAQTWSAASSVVFFFLGGGIRVPFVGFCVAQHRLGPVAPAQAGKVGWLVGLLDGRADEGLRTLLGAGVIGEGRSRVGVGSGLEGCVQATGLRLALQLWVVALDLAPNPTTNRS